MWRKLQPWLKGFSVLAIVGLCLFLILPIQNKIKLGLDLQGGVRVLLELRPSPEVPKITPQIQAQVEQVIQGRINGLGVA
jgi:preprotein translocase subunit SecD